MRVYVAVAVIVLSAFSAAGAIAAPFTNGSFELPVLPYNGRFENSIPADWQTYASATCNPQHLRYDDGSVYVPDGVQYGQMQVTTTYSWAGLRQTFDAVPGLTYNVAGWFRSLSGTAWARVGFDTAGGTTRPTNWLAELNNPSGATPWTQFSGQVTATGTSMTIFLDCEIAGSNNKAASFDGITIEPVPEPGSVIAVLTGLIGLGGLAVRRRR
ncbi:MAG: PEP-CTERM sorting domain-containing protein [Armatimonadota bacterium]